MKAKTRRQLFLQSLKVVTKTTGTTQPKYSATARIGGETIDSGPAWTPDYARLAVLDKAGKRFDRLPATS